MSFTLEQTFRILLNDQCDDDRRCLQAVESQLAGCIESSAHLDDLVASGGNDEALSEQVSWEVMACIVDDSGEPYFVEVQEDVETVDPPPAPRTVIPR